MKLLDRTTSAALLKLIAFLVVTGLATAGLAVVIGNLTFEDKTKYHAVFTDVTSLIPGDDVRISGVRVGNVTRVAVRDRQSAVVSFEVDSSVPLTASTTASLRYRNMIGQRYIALEQSPEGSSDRLDAAATIPVDLTTPALDLTTLFNGFKPLFKALSPEETNELAYEIIQVFQGESGTVTSLLDHTSILTNALADRDELIGSVIDNLTAVLTTFNDRSTEFSATIRTLQQFITGLKNDREALTGSLGSIAGLATETADLLEAIRPDLTKDIAHLNTLTGKLNRPKIKRELSETLEILPIKLDHLRSISGYGAFFNFYACDLSVNGTLPALEGVPGWEKPRTFQTQHPETVTGEGEARCAKP